MGKLMKKIKNGYKRVTKCVNGTKGVISLFLAILMVPFTTIAGALLDAARFNSAVALFDEALCNASNSTLGTYDEFLRERFGLLAMSQDTSSLGSGYTAQDFIEETFSFYMEQNGFVLNNTFKDTEYSAAGIYPLSDTSVMLTQILEYSKYTVPTKLVVDGLSIDDLLNTLLEKLDVGAKAINTMSAGVGMVDSALECQTAFNTLITEIGEYQTSKTEYETGYTNFKNAVVDYNNMISERATQIANCESVLRTKETERDTEQREMETEKAKVQSILDQIEALKNQKDADGKPIDNSAKIAALEDSNSENLQPYYDALEEYETAQDAVNEAQSDLTDTKNYYNEQVGLKRTTLTNTKSTYVSKITDFANANDQLGSAISGAESAYNGMKSSAVNVGTNFANTIYASQKSQAEKNVDDLEQKKDAAKDNPNTKPEDLAKIEQDLTDAKNNKTDISNENKLLNATLGAQSAAVDSLESFFAQKLQDTFSVRFSDLIELRNDVRDEYTIPTDNTTRASNTDGYYASYAIVLTKETVESLLTELVSDVVSSTFMSLVKAIIAFFKALLSISIWFDPELCATIDTSLYAGQGGLPSKKNRTGTQYSIDSPFADEDSQRSDEYKQIMGAYSDAGTWPEAENPIEEFINSLMDSIEAIQNEIEGEWTFKNFFEKIANLCSHFLNVFEQIVNLFNNIKQMIAEAIYNKALLSGYLAYNVPNRTTYTGSGITGKGYSLPNASMGRPTYTFYGAEAEYLIAGTNYEYLNQTAVFYWVYLTRLIFDIPYVILNSEVGTFASEATAATAWIGGIGGPIVYGLYFILEAFVDTIILVNGSDVPIIKTKIFLTPSGVTSLIGKIINIGMDEATKKSIYNGMKENMGDMVGNDKFADNFESEVTKYKAENGSGLEAPSSDLASDLLDSFSFDYTKKLFIIMMFIGTEKLLGRFSDIVQMEATYNAHYGSNRTYNFDLDQSYTYLRASGNFEAIRFMKLADSVDMISSKRVIYRGY